MIIIVSNAATHHAVAAAKRLLALSTASRIGGARSARKEVMAMVVVKPSKIYPQQSNKVLEVCPVPLRPTQMYFLQGAVFVPLAANRVCVITLG